MDRKYRDFKPKYLNFLDSDQFYEERSLIKNNVSESISNLILQFSTTKLSFDFFESIFHMHINRTFCSEQRLFEMVIYDYLSRLNVLFIYSVFKGLK